MIVILVFSSSSLRSRQTRVSAPSAISVEAIITSGGGGEDGFYKTPPFALTGADPPRRQISARTAPESSVTKG